MKIISLLPLISCKIIISKICGYLPSPNLLKLPISKYDPVTFSAIEVCTSEFMWRRDTIYCAGETSLGLGTT